MGVNNDVSEFLNVESVLEIPVPDMEENEKWAAPRVAPMPLQEAVNPLVIWPWESDLFASVFVFGCSAAMIFGGVVPFIPQYLDIKRTGNTEGFSLYVCLALLVANTLRILFWFGHPFELPLLAQSIIMTTTMMAMVHACVNIRKKLMIIKGRDRSLFDEGKDDSSGCFSQGSQTSLLASEQRLIWDFDMRYFWEWTDFASYVVFMATFTVVVAFLLYLFINISVFVEFVGFMAVFVEAMLGTPQFYRNFKNKSTVGMSKKMVGMWTLGDTYKTMYFLMREAPVQFWVCGILQVCVDVSILFQTLIYRSPAIVRVRSLSSH